MKNLIILNSLTNKNQIRKKLKEDERIKLTNVHGVGYKLELES